MVPRKAATCSGKKGLQHRTSVSETEELALPNMGGENATGEVSIEQIVGATSSPATGGVRLPHPTRVGVGRAGRLEGGPPKSPSAPLEVLSRWRSDTFCPVFSAGADSHSTGYERTGEQGCVQHKATRGIIIAKKRTTVKQSEAKQGSQQLSGGSMTVRASS